MFSRLRSVLAAVAIGLLVAVPGSFGTAPAQTETEAEIPQQVELTPELVEGFLESYPKIRELGAEFEREYGRVEFDPEDPTSAPMAYARYAEAKERMETILAAHGIASLEEWTRIAYSVMLAYSFAEGGENIGAMDQEMADAIAQIEEDDAIPAAQKEQLLAMLQQQITHLGRLRPPPGNVEIVAEYADRIRQTVAEIEDE